MTSRRGAIGLMSVRRFTSLAHNDSSIGASSDTVYGFANSTKVSKGTFAAVEQWYKKNPLLFKAEVALMRKRFPDAKYRILDSGTMVWLVTLNISKTGFCKPWTFMLHYAPDHPENTIYGSSIKAILVSPNLDELRQRAAAAGYSYVPHIMRSHTADGKDFICLSLVRPGDMNDRDTIITAAQVAARAATWALHFELGLRDETVWNNWGARSRPKNRAAVSSPSILPSPNSLAGVEPMGTPASRTDSTVLTPEATEEIQLLTSKLLEENACLLVRNDGVLVTSEEDQICTYTIVPCGDIP